MHIPLLTTANFQFKLKTCLNMEVFCEPKSPGTRESPYSQSRGCQLQRIIACESLVVVHSKGLLIIHGLEGQQVAQWDTKKHLGQTCLNTQEGFNIFYLPRWI